MFGNSIGLAGLYHFNPQSDFSPFVKLGVHSWEIAGINKITGVSVKTSGADMFYGVGVDGKINDNMKFRLELEHMQADSNDEDEKHFNIGHIGVGLLFDF